MRPAWRVADVRAAEQALMATLPPGTLMRRAAGGLAAHCARLLAGRGGVYGARVLLLVGSGDNGGDALYAGARLAGRGAAVEALLLNPGRAHQGGLAALRAAGGRVVTEPPAGADLVLDVTVRRTRTGSARTSAVGRLRHLTLTFADALAVRIAALTFRAESGRKVEFGASGVELGFEGPLAFVGTLRSVLPADGFDDPPFVTADAQGVVAGYTLGVPSLAVGVFSIQNIAVSAALSIPFTDRPAGARFGIAERHKPFLVTVSLFGGGGFFALGVSAAGLETVEASLEFGGAVSLNLGVASGGVELMAGIYFGLRGTSIELTGYLRCSGALTVLGLVSLSVQFHLGLTYRKKEPRGSEVWGQASLTVSVAVAFFSTSVTLAVERRFAGSGGDPSFADTVTPSQWARYLQAFA